MTSAIRTSEEIPGLDVRNPDVLTSPGGIRLVPTQGHVVTPEPIRTNVDVRAGRVTIVEDETGIKLVTVHADGSAKTCLDLGPGALHALIDGLYAAKLRRRSVTL